MAGRRGARYARSEGGPRGAGGVWLNKAQRWCYDEDPLDILDLANLGETGRRETDDDDESEDEEDDDRNEELDPAVIREPDE